MPQDGSPFMGWLGREAPGIAPRAGELSNNPKDAIGRTKAPMHLIPPPALVEVAKVMGLGAAKYGAYNWRDASVAATVYIAAAQRHLAAFLDGENADPESGALHLAHTAACMAILIDAFATGNVVDDRPKPGPTPAMLAARAKPFCQQVKAQSAPPLNMDNAPAPAPAPREFLWYVATPYTASPLGIGKASDLAADALRELLRREVRAFCPIAHSHIAGCSLPQDHEFWMAVDRPFMDRCDGLLVLRQPGWKESKGVTEEIKTFSRAGKPVQFASDPNLWTMGDAGRAGAWDDIARNLADTAAGRAA